MKMQSTKVIGILALCAVMLALVPINADAPPAQAQAGGYEVVLVGWGSGGRTSGGNYTMNMVIGQPEADQIRGGDYLFSGGIGAGPRHAAVDIPEPDQESTIYLPFVVHR